LPIWLFHCTAQVSPHTPRLKNETQFQQEQKPQTSSHKAQPLQVAVSLQGCCNRFRAVVADQVAALHSTRQSSSNTIKREKHFQQEQKPQTSSSHKAQHLQVAVAFQGCCNRFCAVAADLVAALHSTRQPSSNTIKREKLIQQEQNPQTSSHKAQLSQVAVSFQGCCNRFCAVVANLVVALHSTRQRWRRAAGNRRKTCSRNGIGKNITRIRVFTLLISPVFTRAANKARSAAETSQLFASIVSALTSNSFLPNFTFAMEHAAATMASSESE
jgi:hypothetical protein